MNRINTNSYGSFHDLLDYIVSKCEAYWYTLQAPRLRPLAVSKWYWEALKTYPYPKPFSAANTGEDSGTINMEETLDDFITMYAAGNSTTQITLNFLLNEVVRNPRVLELLVEEVRQIL
eukprot:sb/3476352/